MQFRLGCCASDLARKRLQQGAGERAFTARPRQPGTCGCAGTVATLWRARKRRNVAANPKPLSNLLAEDNEAAPPRTRELAVDAAPFSPGSFCDRAPSNDVGPGAGLTCTCKRGHDGASTASCKLCHKERPLATTSMRCVQVHVRAHTLCATRAPASRHTRATARSSGTAPGCPRRRKSNTRNRALGMRTASWVGGTVMARAECSPVGEEQQRTRSS